MEENAIELIAKALVRKKSENYSLGYDQRMIVELYLKNKELEGLLSEQDLMYKEVLLDKALKVGEIEIAERLAKQHIDNSDTQQDIIDNLRELLTESQKAILELVGGSMAFRPLMVKITKSLNK